MPPSRPCCPQAINRTSCISNIVALQDPIGAVLYARELNDRSELYRVSCSISMLSSYSRRAQIRCAFLSICLHHRTYADTRATPGSSKAETNSPHAPMFEPGLHKLEGIWVGRDEISDLLLRQVRLISAPERRIHVHREVT